MGEIGVEEDVLKKIESIIRSNTFIKDVKNQKAVKIGTHKFRFFAEITLDTHVIIDILEVLHNSDYKSSSKSFVKRYKNSYKDEKMSYTLH